MLTASLTFEMDKNITDKLLKGLPRRLDSVAQTLKGRIAQSLKVSNQHGINPSDAGQTPNYGNGELIRGLYWDRKDEFTRRVGVRGVAYAMRLELGGHAPVKNKQWLTIPVSPEALRHKTLKRSSREFPRPLRFRPTAGGRIAFLVETKRNREVIHYLLRKDQYILARPYLRPALADSEFRRIAVQVLAGAAHGGEFSQVEDRL